MERQLDPRQVNDIVRGAKELNDFVLKTGLCLRHKTEQMRCRAQRSDATRRQTGTQSLSLSPALPLARETGISHLYFTFHPAGHSLLHHPVQIMQQ